MALRDTNPQRLEALILQKEQAWENSTPEERVQQTWDTFIKVYMLLADIAWDIEASRGNLARPSTVPPQLPEDGLMATVRDQIASQALDTSATIADLMDELEAQQQIISGENFGDDSTPTGKSSSTVVVLINCLRPIAEVIQDAAAETKSGTMDSLQSFRRRQPNSQT